LARCCTASFGVNSEKSSLVGVPFVMLSPTTVTGRNANPVFAELARQQREPSWDFNKYLVSPDGRVSAYFNSSVTPESPQLNQATAALLGNRLPAPEV